MTQHKWSWVIAALTIAASLASLLYIDSNADIPIHWNIAGEVDGTAKPLIGILTIPGVQITIIVIFSALKILEPRQKNLASSAKALTAVVLAFTGFLMLVQAQIIDEALQTGFLGLNIIFIGVGLLLVVMGNYFSKLRSSFFIGIRTPWTLSSETVWQKTHRLGGKLFILAGLFLIGGSWIMESDQISTLLLVTILPASLIPVAYSWYLWQQEKKDIKEH